MENKIAVLKGIGPNDLVIIGMAFASLEEGEQYIDTVFKQYDGQTREKSKWYRVDGGDHVCTVVEAPVIEKEAGEADGHRYIRYNYEADIMNDEYSIDGVVKVGDDGYSIRIGDKFFTSYYDGCGECWMLILEEIPFGTPLVKFDLD